MVLYDIFVFLFTSFTVMISMYWQFSAGLFSQPLEYRESSLYGHSHKQTALLTTAFTESSLNSYTNSVFTGLLASSTCIVCSLITYDQSKYSRIQKCVYAVIAIIAHCTKPKKNDLVVFLYSLTTLVATCKNYSRKWPVTDSIFCIMRVSTCEGFHCITDADVYTLGL